MHLGFNPVALLRQADAVLVIDSDVPWYPSMGNPSPGCQVIHVGIDPIYSSYPIRSFPCDLAIRADPAATISTLHAALRPIRRQSPGQFETRFARYRTLHEEQRARRQEALAKVSDDSPLDPLWISHCIDAIKDDNTSIVNEYDLVGSQVAFSRPGTYFSTSPAGGLGWGLGASLGIKLGAPDRLVITTVGDGSYMFGNPTACHLVSQAQGLPTLTVIFNNSVWNSVRRANLTMYPDGWGARTGHFPLTDLAPSPRFELLAAAHGGYGERVEVASEVRPALARALRVVREEGRLAVLNMVCKHHA